MKTKTIQVNKELAEQLKLLYPHFSLTSLTNHVLTLLVTGTMELKEVKQKQTSRKDEQ